MSNKSLVKGAPSGITDGSQRGLPLAMGHVSHGVRPTRPHGGGGVTKSRATGTAAKQSKRK